MLIIYYVKISKNVDSFVSRSYKPMDKLIIIFEI